MKYQFSRPHPSPPPQPRQSLSASIQAHTMTLPRAKPERKLKEDFCSRCSNRETFCTGCSSNRETHYNNAQNRWIWIGILPSCDTLHYVCISWDFRCTFWMAIFWLPSSSHKIQMQLGSHIFLCYLHTHLGKVEDSKSETQGYFRTILIFLNSVLVNFFHYLCFQ